MEMLIRTPDMPGVHRNSNDVSEVGPSDYISTVQEPFDRNDLEENTNTLLYVNPETHTKRIYQSYNNIIDAVNKCIRVGAGIIWDSYQKFIKLKSNNPEKYEEAISEMIDINSNSYFSAFNKLTNNKKLKTELENEFNERMGTAIVEDNESKTTFRGFFTNILGDNNNNDIPALLDKTHYLDEIARLRNELSMIGIGSNFRFDVENCIEYTIHRSDCYFSTYELNSIAFKIKPFLNKISSNVATSIYDSIPVVSYGIYFDMHKLVIWLLNNCKMPDELPDMIDSAENVRDEFINSVLGEFPNFGESISRRIVTELFDMDHNIRGNWRKFLTKFIHSYSKSLDAPEIINLLNKVNYFAELSESHNDPSMKKESLDVGILELFKNIFTFINGDYVSDNHEYIDDLFNSMSYYSNSNKNDFFIKFASILFRKTFTVFFEDAVLINYRNPRRYDKEVEHFGKTLYIDSYTREFYRSYDITDLLGKASTITDYNVRDFIQTILSESKSCKLNIFDPGKLSNGEYAFFMYSKHSRKIWMCLTNYLIFSAKITGMMEQTKPRNDKDLQLFENIKKRVNHLSETLYGLLLSKSLLTEARFLPNRYISAHRYWDLNKQTGCDHIIAMIRFCNDYSKPVVSRDSHKIDDLIHYINKNSDYLSRTDDGFIVSYNANEIDYDEMYHNFSMALKRRELVSLDF